jgi:hypothetical protein
MLRNPAREFVLASSLLILTACGDSPAEPDPTPDPDPGNIEVSATTTGIDLDGDGYSLDANGIVLPLAINGSATYSSLAPGAYSVTLSGEADNCEIVSDNPVSVTVVSTQTATASFTVECTRIPGPMTLVGADGNGNIYVVNEDTGEATHHLDTSTSDGAGGFVDVGVVSSMLYVPETDKWWIGTGGNGACDGCIQTLDPSTGLVTTLHERPIRDGVSGLAIHPATERIFSFGSDSSQELYEIDPTTGVFTLIVDTLDVGWAGKGTTFSTDGELFVVGEGDLYTVDPDTGAWALIGQLTLTGFPTLVDGNPDVVSMTTRASDGVVLALLRDGRRRDNRGTYLLSLNLETAEATLIGETLTNLEGLAFVPTSMINP